MEIEITKLPAIIATIFGVIIGVHWMYQRDQKTSQTIAVIILVASILWLIFSYNAEMPYSEQKFAIGLGYFLVGITSFYIVSRNSYLKNILFKDAMIFIPSVLCFLYLLFVGIAGITGNL